MRAVLGRPLAALAAVGVLTAIPATAIPATAVPATAAPAPSAQSEQQAQPAGQAAEADILDRLLAIPGVSLVEEKPVDGYRFFVLNFTQPVDHRDPSAGTFQQRITVLHKDTSRPTVFYTGGYNVSTNPGRSEPTRIVDGNQVSMEYRYFTPSRPEPADWSKLDIWQAASDQHAVFEALKPIYDANWLATGGSKGGMTATYYERFYPRDMDGVVPYVAPNDVVNKEDSAYDDFFATVGTPECRDRLDGVQREALVRRDALEKRYRELADKEGYTFSITGSLDRAYEAVVLDYVWAFWQYAGVGECTEIPADAARATDQEIWESVDHYSGFSFYTDQGLTPYTPYYYQAGTQMGSPTIGFPAIEKGLIRYGYPQPRNLVPSSIPMRFQPQVMRDVDNWVRKHASRMLFVYGSDDPWGAERFRVGRKTDDSYVFTAPGANHGASVAALRPEERDLATARIQEWAGVAPAAVVDDPSKAEPLTSYDHDLDKKSIKKERSMRP